MAKDAFDQMADAYEAELLKTVRVLVVELYRYTRMDSRLAGNPHGSPVRSGRFSASVRIGVRVIDKSSAPAVRPYPRRDLPPSERIVPLPPISQAAKAMDSFKLGDTVYVSVTLPYANRIEEGYSPKTPDGVMMPSMVFWERVVQSKLKAAPVTSSVIRG